MNNCKSCGYFARSYEGSETRMSRGFGYCMCGLFELKAHRDPTIPASITNWYYESPFESCNDYRTIDEVNEMKVEKKISNKGW